jgi:SAM-dependent methyltransferase
MSKYVPSAFHLRFLIVGCVIIMLAAGMRFFLYQRVAERKTDASPLPQPVVDAPFITTPDDIVDKILELAQVRNDDLVYDLGCGDGRIVVAAAKKYGCRAVGFDIDPERVKEALENAKKNQVDDLVTIQQEDIFDLDLGKANVVTLYLLPGMNLKLIPQLEKLKPGARIVSHDFDLGSIQPDKIVRLFCQEDGHQHVLYLWVAPIRKN